jgi:hypothetical protein
MDTPTAITIVGLGATAGKEAVSVVGHFVKEIFGPTSRAVGMGIAAPVRAWAERRVERAKQLVIDAAILADKKGITPHAVPGRVLLPILEYASVEEDNEMQRRWAALLASSATESSIPPSFPRLLSDLGPLEVYILSSTYKTPPQGPLTYVQIEDILSKDTPLVSLQIAIATLIRLGLIALNGGGDDSWEELSVRTIILTGLGKEFTKACEP